jgi:hypothetical protein
MPVARKLWQPMGVTIPGAAADHQERLDAGEWAVAELAGLPVEARK